VTVEIGYNGVWSYHTISRTIQEEFNALISAYLGFPAATPDFTAAPLEDHQYRFYPDVSHGPPIWITLKQSLKRSRLTTIMRVPLDSTQAEIEKAVSILWAQQVEFRKFPAVLDPNDIYWMRPHTEDAPEEDEPFPEPNSLDAIPHIETPTYKPPVGSFVRSHSTEDLARKPSPVMTQKSADCLAKWTLMLGHTVVTYWAPEDAPVETVVDRAAAAVGIPKTQWRIRIADHFRIFCEDTTLGIPEASIHFGNMEWRGKVEPSCSSTQLIEGAQVQLEIEGKWQMRTEHWGGRVRCIEAERISEELFYPPLPEETEIWFNFGGCVLKGLLPEGADRIAQATKAQQLFNQTRLCSPIVNAGDPYEITLSKPKLFPVTVIHQGERVSLWCDSTQIKVIAEEARRVLGISFNLERDIKQPGLVFNAKPKSTRSTKPKPADTIRTRNYSENPMASPCVAHMRASGPQPLDIRSEDRSNVRATGPDAAQQGISVIVMFPQIEKTIYHAALAETATHEEIVALIARQLKVQPIHPDFLEFAPDDGFARKRITVRHHFTRPDLSTLEIVNPIQFTARFDPSIPIYIETDGACSGNPGPGGCGCIICQGAHAIDAHGPNPATSNNEMELQAIAEALEFIPKNVACYVTIESDSEGCLNVMLGAGERWRADNYVNLKGNRVKNKEFIDKITLRLHPLHAQLKKIKGHNNDQ
jgi:ribonuclease HI